MAAIESEWSLNLLGSWRLLDDGAPVEVGPRQQRVIAILALLGRRPRKFIASRLWPDSADTRAVGNLRVSLFKIAHEQPALIRASADAVALDVGVDVDVDALRDLIDGTLTGNDMTGRGNAIEALRSAELLPGWYDDWVLFEQERLDQRRLAALEVLAQSHLDHGDPDSAVDAATAALAIEPFRESSQLLLLRAHLDAGNRAQALHVHQFFERRLAAELGIVPSPQFARLLETSADS